MRTLLVTFSGTHGTGKSTHAGRCYYSLNNQGHKFAYVRHQDILDPFGFVLRRAARILGCRTSDLERTEPARVLWSLYLVLVYLPLLVGGIRVRRMLGYNVVVDRYLYDMLVGFWGNHVDAPLQRLLIWTVTHPDVSFVLDADENRILRERPEHSTEFIRNEKRLYGKVAAYFHIKRIHTTESAATVSKALLGDIDAALNSASRRNVGFEAENQ